MKITEIISEAGFGTKVLGTTLGAFKSAEKPILGSVKDFVEQAGERIASIAKSRGISLNQAADEVFKVPTKEQEAAIQKAMSQGYTREKAMSRLGLESHPYYQDAKLKEKAIKAAKSKTGTDIIGKAGEAITTTGKVVKGTFATADWLAYIVAQFVGLAPPYMQFRKNMEGAAEMLDSKDWTQEQFDGYADRQVGILLARWTEVLAAGALARLLPNLLAKKVFMKSDNAILQSIGRTTMIGGSALAVAAQGWANDPANADAFAKVMISPFLSWLPDSVGGVVRQAINSFAGGIGLGAAGGTPTTSNKPTTPGTPSAGTPTDGTGQAGKPTTNQQTSTTSTDQMLGNRSGADYSTWKEVPGDPNWIRNPADPMDIALKPAGWKKQ